MLAKQKRRFCARTLSLCHPFAQKLGRYRLTKTNASSPRRIAYLRTVHGPYCGHCGASIMNTQVRSANILSTPQTRPSILAAVLSVLVTILSGAKGDQGGWEGGARGL
jgi:hypothetical protein